MNPKFFDQAAHDATVSDPTTVMDPLAFLLDQLGHLLSDVFTFFQDFLNHTLAAFLF